VGWGWAHIGVIKGLQKAGMFNIMASALNIL
jgi:predicted acylesterase/phospholipase RssA